MQRIFSALGASCFVGLVACSAPAPAPPGLVLTEDSGEDLGSVPAVARLRIGGLRDLDPGEIWIVEGDVSSVSQGKLRRNEVPKTIESSRIPLVAWTEGADVVLAPSVLLEPSQQYSVIAIGLGLLGEFQVSEEAHNVLWQWGASSVQEGATVFYCKGPPPVWTSPEEEGDAAEPCVSLSAWGGGHGTFVPPQSMSGWLLDPQPITVLAGEFSPPGETGRPRACARRHEPVTDFVGGCAWASSGGLSFALSAGTYWASACPESELESEPDSCRHLLSQDAGEVTQYLGPLAAETKFRIDVRRAVGVFGLGDTVVLESLSLETGPKAARFVLTEALVDPLGAEPESEWVEVLNVGQLEGSLGGLELWDSGGGVALPEEILQPGEYGLIVREDFSLGPDVTPHASSKPIVVGSLGENGLRNSGEQIELRTASGEVLSRIPAIPARAGASVSRIDPWSPDTAEFFIQSDPASPGAPNILEEP